MKTKSTSPKALRSSLIRLDVSAIVLILVGWCSTSLATITITGVTNASNITGLNTTTGSGTASASATPSSTQGQVNVYGGLAGPADAASCTPISGQPGICNNCITATDGLYDCNEKRILPSGQIQVTFSSGTTAGIPAASFVNVTSGVASAIPLVNAVTTTVPKGSSTSVTFLWSAICGYLADKDGAAASSSDCSSTQPASGIIRIGIIATGSSSQTLGSSDDAAQVNFTVAGVQADAANSTQVSQNGRTRSDAFPCSTDTAVGISCFAMYPGDGKATIRDVVGLNGFPVGSLLAFQGAQLFYAKGGFGSVVSQFSYQEGHSGILPATSDSTTLSPADVDGLENEQLYRFKVAAVDLAGNVSFFTADAHDQYCAKATSPISTTDGFCHEAKPGVVYGALGKNPSCFIATAAYGSPMAPQVDTFRQFRNRFLLGHSWGKSFVRFYYKYSPKYAKIIADSDALRTLALVALWPILAFVSLSLKFGLINALLLILAVLAIPVSFYVLRQNRGARA